MNQTTSQSKPAAPVKPPVNPRPAILLGLLVILLAFGGFGTWATLAPIASAVIAPSVVIVDSSRKKIQHPEGGVVKELLVRDGDLVQAQQVLIRLDETQSQASLAILQARYDAALAVEARLLAEREGVDSVAFPAQLLKRMQESKIGEILAGQQNLFEARRSALAGEMEILRNRVIQLEDDIRGIKAQQQAKERQIALIQEEALSIKGLVDKGYADRPRYLALMREAARLEGERGEHSSAIARANTRIGETRLQMIQLRRDLREQVVSALRTARTEISDLEERLSAARHTLEHIEIRAPEEGVVVGMAVHTIGGVIRPGDTILEVVPVNDRLIIEARIQPRDIDNIALGQPADVQFTAFKSRNLPSLRGEVIYISADRLLDNRTGEAYYLARVVVTDDEVARLGDRRLQPGMPAEVMIQTGERTALQYLAQPLLDSLDRAWREE